MPDFVVRKAKVSDANGIFEVNKDSRLTSESYLSIFGKENIERRFDKDKKQKKLESYKKQMFSPGEVFLVISNKEEVVGFANGGKFYDDNLYPENYATGGIYIKKQRQNGKGVGSKLFKKLLEELPKVGYEYLYYCVLESNYPAKKFYEKHNGILQDRIIEDENSGVKIRENIYIWDLKKTI